MRSLIIILLGVLLLTNADAQTKPNIIFILTDDMGFGDIGCFNGIYKTPNIDRMAEEGRRFTGYYSAAPICSPSRVGFLTGTHPANWNITSFLQTKKGNRACGQADFLDPSAPSIAKTMKGLGYATGHFGKWHMGGGRDVTEAPNFDKYGFDEWSSTYESPSPDPLLTATNWIWSDKDSIKRWNRTKYFVDKTLAFLEKNKGKPSFINLWPDDVHTPWVPGDDVTGRWPGYPEQEKSFIGVLTEYDKQIGRLFEGLKKLGIDKNTIVVFTSDNGPLPNFRHDRSAALRGTKLSLYEGGIRMPFIIRWPGKVPAKSVDTISVITAYDLTKTFAALASGRSASRVVNENPGTDITNVLLGKSSLPDRKIFWEYGRNDTAYAFPKGRDRSPVLAVRDGRWKLLMNSDKSGMELYDISLDKNENNNVLGANPAIGERLSRELAAWRKSLP